MWAPINHSWFETVLCWYIFWKVGMWPATIRIYASRIKKVWDGRNSSTHAHGIQNIEFRIQGFCLHWILQFKMWATILFLYYSQTYLSVCFSFWLKRPRCLASTLIYLRTSAVCLADNKFFVAKFKLGWRGQENFDLEALIDLYIDWNKDIKEANLLY